MADFKIERLFHDPTPNQIVAFRLGLNLYDKFKLVTLSHAEQKELQEVVRRVSLKLIAAWKSVDAYRNITISLVEASRQSPQSGDDPVRRIEPSQELYEHLDAFLTQCKSSLDYLVKAGRPIFGPKRWTLRTFSNEGKKVQNALEKLPAEFQPAANQLASFVSSNHDWLAKIIAFRDWMNHGLDGGPDPVILTVHSEKQGEDFKTYCPLFESQPMEDYLLQMWCNVFQLAEAFVAYLLWARAQTGVRLYFNPVPADCQESPWALFPEGLLESIGHKAHCVGCEQNEPNLT